MFQLFPEREIQAERGQLFPPTARNQCGYESGAFPGGREVGYFPVSP